MLFLSAPDCLERRLPERSRSAPHLLRNLDDPRQLGPLLLGGEDVAFLGRGETALRREAELIERRIFARFLDPALDRTLVLELAGLGGDEPEHHDLVAFGKRAQRLKPAGTLGVPFEEIAIDREIIEQLVCNRLISTAANEGRAEIAAAKVGRNDHIGRLGLQGSVEHLAIEIKLPVRIVAAIVQHLALILVAEIREGYVVDLKIAAARVVERPDRLAVGLREIGVVVVKVRIDLFAHDAPAAAVVEHTGRRDHGLRRARCVGLEELEMLDMRVACWKIQLADHAHHPWLEPRALEGRASLSGGLIWLHPVAFATAQVLEKVEMPERAPELAVGNCLKADLFLFSDCLLDFLILDRLELRQGDLALLALPARRLQRGGPQQAADLIGSERRFLSLHRFLSHLMCADMLATAWIPL